GQAGQGAGRTDGAPLMNAMRTIALVVVGAAAGLAASCAPVDAPVPEPKDGPPGVAPAPADPPSPRHAPGTDALRGRVEAAIAQVRQRDLLTTNGFWTVFHAILGLGPAGASMLDPDTGKRVNALEYVAGGAPVRGLRFIPTRDGVDVETRPGTFVSQGHQDQFV